MSTRDLIATELVTHRTLIDDYKLDFEALADLGAALLDEAARARAGTPVRWDGLDEIVYDCAGEDGARGANLCADDDAAGQDARLEAVEIDASAINNAGLAAQVAFVLACYGATDGRRIVRGALGLA